MTQSQDLELGGVGGGGEEVQDEGGVEGALGLDGGVQG